MLDGIRIFSCYMTYLSIKAYADRCGVSRNAIYERERRGQIKIERSILPDGEVRPYIDTDAYPPVEKMKYSGKK